MLLASEAPAVESPPTHLDLDAIRATLDAFEAAKPVPGRHRQERIDRLIAAYARLDRYMDTDHDLLASGASQAVLELNHIVLFGPDAGSDTRFERALEASETRFYDGDETAAVQGVNGGIADLIDWCAAHRGLAVHERAAGVLIRVLLAPQLFVEGNHRSAALLASFELLRDGLPPLVFSAHHAPVLFACTDSIARMTRGSLSFWLQERRLRRRLGELIVASGDPHHLCAGRGVRA